MLVLMYVFKFSYSVFDQLMFFFLFFFLYTIILNAITKTGFDCNARPEIINIVFFLFSNHEE